ncbi:glyoxylate reductase/D-3-phosphoglycerate dehydrogenase [Tistlia consotensis]|uniref:Glyoxylate reductase/D-3-phosphoglycerate dehydrogenase n=1 Tax=Tistlia consotensis USBA 355 TaxID=560819 RepID=A0A1Y6C4L1_9PROT|nr:NAD(P)-dependent oxidoreductase [Tistlia consotensis]SMF36816.1 glyoxylate reductase/D-3-phosphoglycerate dehydrogenase [Tistlia consotensis USBA 355]SNR72141.1 glyoxylate reductase/D-3-phosphoglycerate dehydrogenase [Tistlia consotensis]
MAAVPTAVPTAGPTAVPTAMPVITIADDDPMMQLVRFALEGDRVLSEDWLRDYFSPEPVTASDVTGIGRRCRLFGRCEVRYLSREEEPRLAELSRGSDAIVCRRAVIDAAVITASPSLRMINRLGERATGIDLVAARAAGVTVNCIARPTLAYTAEHAILLMLAVGKALVEADKATRAGRYDRGKVHPIDGVAYNWPGLAGLTGLYGKTLGIVGLGEVGTLVARRAAAFGMRLLYSKPNRLGEEQERRLGLGYRSFERLLEEADVVSLHARAVPETRHLFDRAAFRRMKPGAIFVNTSRGSLVDEEALAAALEGGWIAGAGIDNHAVEPRPAGDRLARLPNIVMTPHIAGGSRHALLEEVEQLIPRLEPAGG